VSFPDNDLTEYQHGLWEQQVELNDRFIASHKALQAHQVIFLEELEKLQARVKFLEDLISTD
jgi:hypothetical protein